MRELLGPSLPVWELRPGAVHQCLFAEVRRAALVFDAPFVFGRKISCAFSFFRLRVRKQRLKAIVAFRFKAAIGCQTLFWGGP